MAKKNKRGRRKYHYKKSFDTWQKDRIYQQDLFNKGVNAEMWEENGGIEIGKCK
ncbi:TPA: hypothetical protein U1578_001372 [Streptococcus suis]|nr:hypothetical protein [Streptococcus suis]NQO06187.1 hypothetical protein [Streptococcus suis]NQO36630.1 hypothetical protein [Streptococcus suis]HEM5432328.1 hypothetical protein [Streptococcus suis]